MAQSTLGKKMYCSPERGVGPSMVVRPVRSLLYKASAAAWLGSPRRVCSNVRFAALGGAKNAVELLGTAVPGKFRSYQSNARNQKTLSFLIGPPTPMPAILRQSVGLYGTCVKLPGEVCTGSLVNGLVAPQTLSRS